jgi:activating signal cointegrator complex subunit 2
VFLLLHRLLTDSPKLLDTPGFLEGFARLYCNVPTAQKLLVSLWKSHEAEVEKAVKALKKKHLPVFSKANVTYDDAASLSRVFQLSPKAAATFLAGEEFVDVALDGDEVVVKLYARAMTEAARVNWSVVVDALYSLTVPSSGKKEKALARRLAGLRLGPKLKSMSNGTESESRVAAVVEKLHELSPPPRKVKSKPAMDKGKGIAAPEPSPGPARTDQEEEETASKVDQIRDMFPHLGAGFVRRCLKEIGSVEEVTMALLEHNLPPQLLEADQSEELYIPHHP